MASNVEDLSKNLQNVEDRQLVTNLAHIQDPQQIAKTSKQHHNATVIWSHRPQYLPQEDQGLNNRHLPPLPSARNRGTLPPTLLQIHEGKKHAQA